MKAKIGLLAIIPMLLLVINPAYAEVLSVDLGKAFYSSEEMIVFVGTQEAKQSVFVIIRSSSGDFKGMLSDPVPDQGEFSVIPRPVTNFFSSEGIYNATAFTDDQNEKEGITIKLEYENGKVSVIEDYVLQLTSIQNPTVDELKTVSFTVSVTDSTIKDVVYSLEGNIPTGATINNSTGKFVWTPSSSHGNSPGAQYTFDIVATKGAQVDKESVTITVNEPVAVPPEPEPEPKTTTEPKTTSEPKELEIPASFVDESKDPQYYIDRYNNEASYKKWFDDNYSEYSSIYEAVGLDEPKELAAFVDPNLDPQYYIDRYNNEASYKKWFDSNYPEYSSIYEAVGVEEDTPEPEFGICGEGTRLIDGVCIVFDEEEFGQCGEGTELVGKTCEIIGNTIEKPKTKPWWQFW